MTARAKERTKGGIDRHNRQVKRASLQRAKAMQVDLGAAKPGCRQCHGRGVVGFRHPGGRQVEKVPIVCACVTRRGGIAPTPWWVRLRRWVGRLFQKKEAR